MIFLRRTLFFFACLFFALSVDVAMPPLFAQQQTVAEKIAADGGKLDLNTATATN
jgi:hypothetical protein